MSQLDALVIGERTFPFHSFDEMGPHVEAALGDGVDATLTEDRDDLLDLSGYDLVVDYLTDSTLTDDQQESLLSFVADGGGYLGMHCAADITSTHDGEGGIDSRDEPIPELHDLIGGYFLLSPRAVHLRRERRRRRPPRHCGRLGLLGVRQALPGRLRRRPGPGTRARMAHPDLEDYPVVWVRDHGGARLLRLAGPHRRIARTPRVPPYPAERRRLVAGA